MSVEMPRADKVREVDANEILSSNNYIPPLKRAVIQSTSNGKERREETKDDNRRDGFETEQIGERLPPFVDNYDHFSFWDEKRGKRYRAVAAKSLLRAGKMMSATKSRTRSRQNSFDDSEQSLETDESSRSAPAGQFFSLHNRLVVPSDKRNWQFDREQTEEKVLSDRNALDLSRSTAVLDRQDSFDVDAADKVKPIAKKGGPFDSIGGGLIPMKRSPFDSLGGGLIPMKRGLFRSTGGRLTPMKRNPFDTLGGGLIPTEKRVIDSIGGGLIPGKRVELNTAADSDVDKN